MDLTTNFKYFFSLVAEMRVIAMSTPEHIILTVSYTHLTLPTKRIV